MKIKILFILFLLVPFFLPGQNTELNRKLEGLDRIGDIMKVVDQHYAEIEAGERERTDEMPYKHWARWALFMSARTAPGGKLVNVDQAIRKATKTYQKKNRSNAGNWNFIGPQSISGTNGSAIGIGRVDRIAFHPTNPNILYIGTPSGGLWKSTNGGSSWTPLTDNFPSVSVSGIVVSHANPNTIYILTGDGDGNGGFQFAAGYRRSSAGAFVSYDAGTYWHALAPLPIEEEYLGYQLVQHPSDANILLAATSRGIFRTNNAGGSWDSVLVGRTYEIKFRPGNANYVYATQSGAFYRSLNAGVTWTEITNFDISMLSGRVALAISNGQPNRVYILSGWNNESTTFGGVYVSYNSGTSFTRQCFTPNIVTAGCDGNGGNDQSSYDLALGVSHVNSDKLIAGGVATWGSVNAGVSWSNLHSTGCGAYTTSTGFVHDDIHDIEYHPLTGEVFVCTDGGLNKSANDGQDWVSLSDGIATSQIYHMAGSLADVDNMIIGLQDNGIKRRNANTNVWDNVNTGDGFDCVYNVNSSTTGYYSSNNKIFRFTNNGASWSEKTPSGPRRMFPRVQVHNTLAGFVLAGYDSLWRSTNYGATWTNEIINGNWDVERCPNNDSRFYVAGGASAFATPGNMWRSDDTGLNWTRISGNTGYPTADLRITDIDVRPTNSAHVYFTLGGFGDGEKVYVSFNSGASWINLSGSLPNVPVNAILVDQNGNMYIGTDIGVFYRGAGMGDWVPYWNRLPIVPVSDLELYESENLIRASTFGRGVWQSDLYSICPPLWVIASDIQGHKYYESSDWITCNKTIYGGQNTDVVFKAGNHIILSKGFQVGKGNRFRGYTAPCGVADIEEE
jgi:photosystem II stability/assembly factor-like uncharacterized protein